MPILPMNLEEWGIYTFKTMKYKLSDHENMIKESYDTIIIKTFQSFKFFIIIFFVPNI